MATNPIFCLDNSDGSWPGECYCANAPLQRAVGVEGFVGELLEQEGPLAQDRLHVVVGSAGDEEGNGAVRFPITPANLRR